MGTRMRMLNPGNRSGRDGGGNGVDDDARLAELDGDLRALYELYRRGIVPQRVVRMIQQLEEAYWNARAADSGEEDMRENRELPVHRSSN